MNIVLFIFGAGILFNIFGALFLTGKAIANSGSAFEKLIYFLLGDDSSS